VTRVVSALAGLAGGGAFLVAISIVWLYLTQPATVAVTIGSGRFWSLVVAAAAAMVSALGDVIQRL